MPDRAAPPVPPAGRLVAVVGPSGAGKDTILSLAAGRLADDPRVHFARRVVTRPAQADAEDHDCLTPEAFRAAREAGGFCLSWHAHGLDYGLPAELADRCRRGALVVANLSRRALRPAVAAFGAIEVVEIHAPPEILARRIAARGRESAADIEARLGRSVALDLPGEAARLHRIENAGTPEAAGDRFVGLVQAILAAL